MASKEWYYAVTFWVLWIIVLTFLLTWMDQEHHEYLIERGLAVPEHLDPEKLPKNPE